MLKQSCRREQGEERNLTEEMLLWKFIFVDWSVDAACLYSTTLRNWAVLVFIHSFSLKIYLFFCLKPKEFEGHFLWWRRIWSNKWLMQANICFLIWDSLKYAFNVPDLWQWEREDVAQYCVFFLLILKCWTYFFAFDIFLHVHRFMSFTQRN